MDATATTDEAGRLLDAENARRDVAGMAFLVGMLVAGALTVAGSLSLYDGPAPASPTQVAVSTR